MKVEELLRSGLDNDMHGGSSTYRAREDRADAIKTRTFRADAPRCISSCAPDSALRKCCAKFG